MIVLGIDPGLHECAYAIVKYDSGVFCLEKVYMVRGSKGLKQSKAAVDMADSIMFHNHDLDPSTSDKFFAVNSVVIEDQEITYTTSQGARIQDIRCLSLVTGALLAKYHDQRLIFPKPAEWKGQIPKEIHHERIAKKLNIETIVEYNKKGTVIPTTEEIERDVFGAENINPGDWYHLWDAAGLAIYGIEQLLIEERTNGLLLS